MKRKPSDLKRDAARLSPVLNVGKNGITDTLVDEIRHQLKRKKLIKVRILKTALVDKDQKEIAEELSRRTGSQLVEVKGSSAVLFLK